MKKEILFLAAVLLLSVSTYAVCTNPLSESVTTDRTYCNGTFTLNNIQINGHNVDILCEGTILNASTQGAGVGMTIGTNIENTTINNCTFTGFATGIGGSPKAYSINNSKFYNHSNAAISVGHTGSVYIGYSRFVDINTAASWPQTSDVLIENNFVKNSAGYGFPNLGGFNIIVRGNYFENITQDAVSYLASTGYAHIYNNIFNSTRGYGVQLASTANYANVSNNYFYNSMGTYAIYINGHRNDITNNYIEGSVGLGLVGFGGSHNNTLTGNQLVNAPSGFYILGGSSGNLFDGNSFTSVTSALYTAGLDGPNTLVLRPNGRIIRLSSTNLSIISTTNNIFIDSNIISMNTAVDPGLANLTANVSFNLVGCPATLYYYNQYSTDFNTIKNSGQICNATTTPACSNIVCDGKTVTFNVPHFDSYGGEGTEVAIVPEFNLATMLLVMVAALFIISSTRKQN